MDAYCKVCGVKADIEIIGDDKHRASFDQLSCRYLQEAGSKPGGTEITGRCPHLEEAVEEQVAKFRQAEEP
jgi:hypothetical protein